jgi:hypothetical protein
LGLIRFITSSGDGKFGHSKISLEISFVAMFGSLSFVAFGFWMLMIFDCVRNEQDRQTWLWLLIFLNVPGGFIYFVARVLPRLDIPFPSLFKRWAYKQKLWNAEAAVRNIGKAHQHIALANLFIEMREWNQAKQHFQQALEKEPNHIDALWGLSVIAIQLKQWQSANEYLSALLKKDAKYKYGDASLSYGRVLFEQQYWDAAIAHLNIDIREWSHPEASWLLAQIEIRQGQRQKAKDILDQMLFKVKASPSFHYRRHRSVMRKAEKLLRTL